MKKSEFKKLLKPIVEECLKDVLLEGNILSNIISEAVKAVAQNQQIIVERQQIQPQVVQTLPPSSNMQEQLEQRRLHKEKEIRAQKAILERVSKETAYGDLRGVFDGLTPMNESQGLTMNPEDPGIDINNLFALIKGK